MSKFVTFLIDRLTEKSTIVTIVTLAAGVVGANLSPENTDSIAMAVTAVVSCIAAFWGSDKPSP